MDKKIRKEMVLPIYKEAFNPNYDINLSERLILSALIHIIKKHNCPKELTITASAIKELTGLNDNIARIRQKLIHIKHRVDFIMLGRIKQDLVPIKAPTKMDDDYGIRNDEDKTCTEKYYGIAKTKRWFVIPADILQGNYTTSEKVILSYIREFTTHHKPEFSKAKNLAETLHISYVQTKRILSKFKKQDLLYETVIKKQGCVVKSCKRRVNLDKIQKNYIEYVNKINNAENIENIENVETIENIENATINNVENANILITPDEILNAMSKQDLLKLYKSFNEKIKTLLSEK